MRIRLLMGMVLAMTGMAHGAEIKVMSGGAPKEAFVALTPKFEKASGHKVSFIYATMSAIGEKIAAGEKVDVLVMPVGLLDGMAKNGKVGTQRATFGVVGLSVIARAGAPKPDIATPEKFKAALLAAKTVVHSSNATPSGGHLGKLMAQLGIADEMAKKTTLKPALDGGVQLVSRGEADLGIYPTSEVVNIEGLEVVGTVPEPLTLNTIYGAAVTSNAVAPDAAASFIAFIADPANAAQWRHDGFDPPPAR